jgi:hypothetical protein
LTRIRSRVLLAAAAAAATVLLGSIAPSFAGPFDYTIVQVSNGTQMQPVIDFTAPYYRFLLTNEGVGPDSYFMEVRNLSVSPTPNWFPQVCLGNVCFGDSTTIMFSGGESDSVGVNVVPFSNGVGTFDFHIESVGDPGLFHDFVGLTLYAGTAAVGAPNAAVEVARTTLSQNFPNPVTGGTRIDFALAGDGKATLVVFDAAGRLVDTLVDGTRGAGAHTVTWSAADRSGRPLPAGVYWYRLSTNGETRTKRMTVIR